jgi:hypothetical protein
MSTRCLNTGPPFDAEPVGSGIPAGQDRRRTRRWEIADNLSSPRCGQVLDLDALLTPVWDGLRALALTEDQSCPR